MCQEPAHIETIPRQFHEQERTRIALQENVLGENDRLAERNRGIFEAFSVFVVNMVSSPGSGKTTLLEKTIQDLKNVLMIGVIEGDQQTSRDTDRINATGAAVHQINTLDACHLDAHMVRHALKNFELSQMDLLFIENVGNLICPAAFDLGEDSRVTVLSVTEGEDKPLKYPSMFMSSQLALLSKIDLLPALEYNLEECLSFLRRVNPGGLQLCVSAKTGQGMKEWYDWLRRNVEAKKRANSDKKMSTQYVP